MAVFVSVRQSVLQRQIAELSTGFSTGPNARMYVQGLIDACTWVLEGGADPVTLAKEVFPFSKEAHDVLGV